MAADVRVLSSDAFEGRAPGTRGEGRTLAYIIRQLRKAETNPAGERLRSGARGWTQTVRLKRYAMKGDPTVAIAIHGQRVDWLQGKQMALRAPRVANGQIRIDSAPIVFVGFGISAPEWNWDDFKGVDLKGKVMLVLVNNPDLERDEGGPGKAMTYYGRWTYKFEQAARRGAAAVLVIHEDEAAGYGWPTVAASTAADLFELAQPNGRADYPLDGWISRQAAVDLLSAAGLDFAALKAQAQHRSFSPVVLDGASLTAHAESTTVGIRSHNVAAVIPGTTRPGETIIYSAHWDHFGIGKPDASGDRIYNGALDNATGVAALLELARNFKASPRTKRSIVFLFLTAEERGLLGSTAYVEAPFSPLSTTVAELNVDTLRPDGIARDFSTMGAVANTLKD